MTTAQTPSGTLALQTLAMPADANPNGDIFGGWLVSQMDLAAGIIAKQRAKTRVVTVAIDSMVFHKPVEVGDIVCCYGDVIKVGRTSMTIKMTVWTISRENGEYTRVTEGIFTFVAVDDNRKPIAVD